MPARFVAHVLATQKLGNRPSEYEDAYALAKGAASDTLQRTFVSNSTNRRQYAVADGATTTSFSKEWANMLVRAFGNNEFSPSPGSLLYHVSRLASVWWQTIECKELPWYAQEKARLGAFAAFAGIKLRAARGSLTSAGIWEAIAVGDSCLVQVRGGTLITTFPLSHSDQFTNAPVLISTRAAANTSLKSAIKTTSGDWCSGDTFFLMTDAFACWFLAQHEHIDKPWETLNALLSVQQERRQTWMDEQRQQKHMRNDDITLLTIRAEA